MRTSRSVGEEPNYPELLPVAEEMTPAERDAYERDCLAELEKRVEHASHGRTAFRTTLLREVRLSGSYPETEIMIRWLDTTTDKERERSYPLWVIPATGGMAFEWAPDGKTFGRDPPSEVALNIQIWVDGG